MFTRNLIFGISLYLLLFGVSVFLMKRAEMKNILDIENTEIYGLSMILAPFMIVFTLAMTAAKKSRY